MGPCLQMPSEEARNKRGQGGAQRQDQRTKIFSDNSLPCLSELAHHVLLLPNLNIPHLILTTYL